MPRFKHIAGNVLFAFWIAEDKAVFLGICRKPFPFFCISIARFEIVLRRRAAEVESKACLVLTVSRAGAVSVCSCFAVPFHVIIVESRLIGIGTVCAEYAKGDSLRLGSSDHIVDGFLCCRINAGIISRRQGIDFVYD